MKPEEIDIFKDLKITLESTIEKLEKISIRKEPREWWLEMDDSDKEIIDIHDHKPSVGRVFTEYIHVREVVE